jgi:dihydrodipicolinate synthase/N-acetylneuraminate lyase
MQSSEEIRKAILSDPIRAMPPWTVALFDPTTGDLPRRTLDRTGLELYSRAIVQAGAPGVLVSSSTGWGHVRTFEEHRETLKTVGRTVLEGTVKQALLRIEDPLIDNIRLIRELKDWDYGILWTRRGRNLPPEATDREVAEHLLPLAREAAENEMPMGVYSISTVDGAPLRASAARSLVERLGPQDAKILVAVKVTESDFETSTRAYLDEPALAKKKIVQGWDAFYARAIQAGEQPDGSNRCGATSGAAACMVHAFREMHRLSAARDWDSLARLQKTVAAVFWSMQGADKTRFPDLQIAKWVMGLGHPLTETRGGLQAERLLSVLEFTGRGPETRADVLLILESLLIMGNAGPYRSPVYDRLVALREAVASGGGN